MYFPVFVKHFELACVWMVMYKLAVFKYTESHWKVE